MDAVPGRRAHGPRRLASPGRRGAVACALGALLAASLVACGGPGDVDIDSPEIDTSDQRVCAELIGNLPTTLGEQPARTVSPSDALGAAWGDPAIVATCGVGVPDGFDEFSSCVQANGVGWYTQPDATEDPTGQDRTFTAVGFRPRLSVTVPASYRPEVGAAVIAELAGPVTDTLELVQPCL